MLKFLIADIHFGKKNNSIRHNEDLLDFFDWMCEYKEQNYPDQPVELVIMGDFFEQRDKINTLTLNYGQIAVNRACETFHVTMLKGNHDLYYRDTRDISSLNVFSELVDLVEFYQIHDNCMYVSWVITGEEYDEIVNVSKEKGIDYIFGHFEFQSFRMNDHYVMEHGQSPGALKHVRHVYTGHFHQHQLKGNVEYIGSPFPFDMNDANDTDRGFVIVDTDNHWDKRVNYDRIKVRSVSADELLSGDWDDAPDTSIRVVLDDSVDDKGYDEIKQKLESTGFRDFKIQHTSSKTKQALDQQLDDAEPAEPESIDALVYRALDGMEEVKGIEKDKLKEIYKSAKELQDEG